MKGNRYIAIYSQSTKLGYIRKELYVSQHQNKVYYNNNPWYFAKHSQSSNEILSNGNKLGT